MGWLLFHGDGGVYFRGMAVLRQMAYVPNEKQSGAVPEECIS